MENDLRNLQEALRTVMQLQLPLFRDNRPLFQDPPLSVAQVKASLDHHRRNLSWQLFQPCSLEPFGFVENSCVPPQTFVPFALQRFVQQTGLSEYFGISLSWMHNDGHQSTPRYMFVSSIGRGIMSLQVAERCDDMKALVHEVLVPMYLRYFDSSSVIQPGIHFKWTSLPQFWPCNLSGEIDWVRNVHITHYMDTEGIQCNQARGLLTFLLSDYWWSEDRLIFDRAGQGLDYQNNEDSSDDDGVNAEDENQRLRSVNDTIKYTVRLLPYRPVEPFWNDELDAPNAVIKLATASREKLMREWMMRIYKQLRKDIKSPRSTPMVFVHTQDDGFYGDNDVVGARGAAARRQCMSCRSMCIQQRDKVDFLRNKPAFVEVRFDDPDGHVIERHRSRCTDQVLIRRDLLEQCPVLRQLLNGCDVLDLSNRGVKKQCYSTMFTLILFLYTQQADAVQRLQQIAGPDIHPPSVNQTLLRRPLIFGKGRTTTDSVIIHPQHRELVHCLSTSCWGPRSGSEFALSIPFWSVLGLPQISQLTAVMVAKVMYRELRGKKL